MTLHARLLVAGLAATACIGGCNNVNTSVTTVQVISKFAGDSQSATVGTVLPVHPAIRITDSDSLPVPNVSVVFAVASGGGTIAGANAVTGADGVATSGDWRLGLTPGANTVTATVSNAFVRFVATGTVAAPGVATP